MPDWSYHPLFRPFVRRLTPERGRTFLLRAMSFVQRLPYGRTLIQFLGHVPHDERLARTLGPLRAMTPIGISHCIDPHYEGTTVFPTIGISVIEVDTTITLAQLRVIPRDIVVLAHCPAEQRIIDEFAPYVDAWLVEDEQPLCYWKPLITVTTVERVPSAIAQIIDETLPAPSLPFIVRGGVGEPNDALQWFARGATFILLDEQYVAAGPGLPKRIYELLLPPIARDYEWKWSFLFGLAIVIGGLLALLFSWTSVILPYDEAFIGMDKEDIRAFQPELFEFMRHDRMTLAGTMISAGMLYMALARYGLRRGLHWAKVSFHSAAIAGFLGIFMALGYRYFDWLHALFWLLLLPIYVLSWRETKAANEPVRGVSRYNHRQWQRGLIGQLLFIIFGASLLAGGVVISFIGVTSVFVATDIAYICATPSEMAQFNDRLIPLIAHDRAGFGSALISSGILVLTTALWGVREGESWLTWTLALASLPALVAGIGTHFVIGYTTFIHLLPAYILLILYSGGVYFLTERRSVSHETQ